MDVISKRVICFSLLIFITACSKEKTKEDVFPQEKLENCSATAVENKFIVQWEDGRVTTESGLNREDFLNGFVEDNLDKIKYVEQDKMIYLNELQNIATNNLTDQETNWGQYQIHADAAWSAGVFGQNVKVAVIDSGVDVEHPQLQSRIAYNKNEIPNNGIDDDKNGYVDDYNGYDFGYKNRDVTYVSDHGTHVSGIIFAEHSSGPIKGVAPDALLVPLNFMKAEEDKNGSYVTGSVGDAIQAILYAAYQRNVRIINASWGSRACSKTLSDVILDVGRNKNVLVITAAGNSGYNLDYTPEFPSAFNLENQINVGASTTNGMQASFSNTSYSLVHLVAPGMGIWSTVPGNSYETMMGTSMAAPFVSGVAALLWSYRPNATLAQIKEAIFAGVDAGPYLVQTKGRVNVEKSMQKLAQNVAP